MGNIPQLIEMTIASIRASAGLNEVATPPEAYGYLLGKHEDGSRFLLGARMIRTAL